MKHIRIPVQDRYRLRRIGLALFAVTFAGLGSYFIFFTHAATLAGDLNGDGTVNITDLSILLSHWGQSGTNVTGDLNSDGVVNVFDLSILLSHYGQTSSGGVPANSTLPAISGSTTVGSSLSASTGTWTNAPTSYAYQWQDCNSSGASCSNISGASSATYLLQSTDTAHTLVVIVTATNASGSASATSAATGVITTSSGSSFVSGAFDLGWQPVGSAAPFNAMNEDFLFALQTENGSGLDTHLMSTVPSVSAWVAAVHAAPHASDRAMITVGGISDQNWQNACNSTNQAAFVSNLVAYMKNNNFDGLDIDMEDNAISATYPVPALWINCATAIINAAHATTTNGHKPIVSEDVTTNWMGPWLQPYETLLDQMNLMTYGDTCTSATNCPTFASDATDTVNQLCPSGSSANCAASAKSRFMLGLDMDDTPGTLSSCGYAAAYAKAQGFMGAFNWDLTSDQHLGSTFPCQTAISANGK